MLYNRKLRNDVTLTGLLPAIVALVLFIFVNLFFGVKTGFKVLSGIIFIYALFQYLAYYRVRSLTYFLSATYMISLSVFLVLFPAEKRGIAPGDLSPLVKIFIFTTIILLIVLVYRLATRKVKWKGREVFELAAAPIEYNTNGFTDRPRPVGRKEYSKNDLLAFAGFLRTNHIALPFIEEDRVILVPVIMGREFKLLYGLNASYKDNSWIAFGFNGDVAVHISKTDYLEFRDQLSFDQLCGSMGELFKEFMDLFLKDERARIINRLDSLGISVFS